LPITATDLQELETILLEQAANDASLVGAAVEAMAEFLNDTTATASQLTFIKMVVECLTRNGAMTNDLLYEQPFTNIAPTGPEAIFPAAKLKQLDEAIDVIRHRAIA
jgi:type I restriction enzyme R subunit